MEEENIFRPDFKCIFCCLAPAEMSFSLRVLANPTEYPEYSDWAKRKFDSLSSNLRQEIEFFNDRYKWYFITDTVVYLMGEEETDVDHINVLLSRFREIDDITFAYIFLGFAAYHYGYDKLEGWIAHPETIRMEDMGVHGQNFQLADVVYFFTHIEEIKRRLIYLYQQYWTEMFHREWNSIREYEQNIIRYHRLKYQHDTPLHYLASLHPDLIVEDGWITFKKEPPYQIAIKDIKKLVLKPSVFVGPTLSGNIVGDKLTITLNLNFHTVKTSAPISAPVLDVIAALNDQTRLRIIKVLWNSDVTTKDLAEILGISPSTASMHLKQLRQSGLVATRKVKKYVYYQLRRDRFYGIEKKLIRYLNY